MRQELWDNILRFDLDSPPSEYGFSIRLAKENFWTKDFTASAILEYKKFMYLAATSDLMVSPSEIVDTVWHQHLIFTQSYHDFCNIIGKQIQHIPSTHNREDFQKFRQAKERTRKLYKEIFGEQPKSIWDFNNMYESLNLEKSKFKIRSFLIAGILIFAALTIPFYFLLRPVYVTIDSRNFFTGYAVLTVLTFVALELFNRRRLSQIAADFDKSSFVFNLHPLELVYLKTQKSSDVINGTLNELFENGTIQVNADRSIALAKNGNAVSVEQLQATSVLSELGRTSYRVLLNLLMTKPVFTNTTNCMDAFKKYFNKSKKFGNLFYLNFGVLALLLMLGFIRLVTGILRDRPVIQIAIAIVLLIALIIFYLNRLTKLVCINTIPNLYKHEILPARGVEGSWMWSYFLLGPAVLMSDFGSLVDHPEKETNYDSGSSSDSSCGSSCGSSCSSCGGCGD